MIAESEDLDEIKDSILDSIQWTEDSLKEYLRPFCTQVMGAPIFEIDETAAEHPTLVVLALTLHCKEQISATYVANFCAKHGLEALSLVSKSNGVHRFVIRAPRFKDS